MVMGSQQSEAMGYRIVRSKFPIANRLGAVDLDELRGAGHGFVGARPQADFSETIVDLRMTASSSI